MIEPETRRKACCAAKIAFHPVRKSCSCGHHRFRRFRKGSRKPSRSFQQLRLSPAGNGDDFALIDGFAAPNVLDRWHCLVLFGGLIFMKRPDVRVPTAWIRPADALEERRRIGPPNRRKNAGPVVHPNFVGQTAARRRVSLRKPARRLFRHSI